MIGSITNFEKELGLELDDDIITNDLKPLLEQESPYKLTQPIFETKAKRDITEDFMDLINNKQDTSSN